MSNEEFSKLCDENFDALIPLVADDSIAGVLEARVADLEAQDE